MINHGVYWQVAVLVFLLTFGLACASAIYFSRIRRGWRLAARSDQPAGV